MSYDIGDVVTLDFTDRVAGVLTDPTAITLTITKPDGTTTSPTPTHVSTGTYSATFTPTLNGLHTYVWAATGTGQGTESGLFYVGVGISVDDVKLRLNKNLTVDDTEIQSMLDAAIAEYAEWVGPVPGSVTRKVDGTGGATILLPDLNVSAVTAAAYTDGTTITVGDLDLDTRLGMLGWGYGKTGYFTGGRRNLTLTYTVGPLPAHHRETIIADVAGYFDFTQAGPAGPDDGYGVANRGAPTVLFPRIRALAPPSVG